MATPTPTPTPTATAGISADLAPVGQTSLAAPRKKPARKLEPKAVGFFSGPGIGPLSGPNENPFVLLFFYLVTSPFPDLRSSQLPRKPACVSLYLVIAPLGFSRYGCGSKNRYQNGTLASGNMDHNLRNPSCLILSHTHMDQVFMGNRRLKRPKGWERKQLI